MTNEEKTELEMWRDGNILHETHRYELEKAERERDKAREDAEHWKTEYLIVAARLCGEKHPRDNGIISEHEIIPKLTRERDEAREKAERYRLEANAMMMQRDEARREVEHLKDMYRTVSTF